MNYKKIKLIHDQLEKTLTVWLGDPETEVICEETSDEVIIMKNNKNQIIGFELLHYGKNIENLGLPLS